jgi:GNAT superfamily N-acetyltransferase
MSSAATSARSPEANEALVAGPADVPALAVTLAAAFHDDPVFGWCFRDPVRRREILPSWFEAIVDANLAHQQIRTTGDVVAGAVWVPPDAAEDEHLAETLCAISDEYGETLASIFEKMDAVHPHEPHFYLFLLGTRPEWQGCGIGSALMRPVLDRCDRDGVPAYLEASSERNRRLYRRYGFELVGEISLPGGPSLWPMWREPADAARRP